MSTSVVVQGRLTRGAAPVEILVAGGRIEAIRPPGATTDRSGRGRDRTAWWPRASWTSR